MASGSGKGLLARARNALRDRALRVKVTSFAGIGVVNTLVDFSLFWFAHLHLGLPIIAANVLSWTVAATGSYVMNSLITFAAESNRKLRARAYVAFLVAQLAGLFANTATVVIASAFLTPLIGSHPKAVLVAKALAIGASFLVNFSLSHFVVFRTKQHSSPEGRGCSAEGRPGGDQAAGSARADPPPGLAPLGQPPPPGEG
jgi:putative flippase GtrA